ncbi:MAG: 3-dehydroquinate synthase [Thiobacillaceae bacterium]|jgi:3-dehydroquinate synthase|nr:3-dehydroquinate synthase [Thiobacillaceae bacterium]
MTTILQQFSVGFSYPVVFTSDVFALENPVLAEVMARGGRTPNRALVVIDSEVADLTPGLLERISRHGEAHRQVMEFVAPPFIVRGGEVCKHEPVEVERIHSLVERHKICRHSFIIAIGGGAVLDAVGYAAATAHRGVRLIRMPTTVLAQNDAGIGVKNSINAFGRKNFLGTFAPPFAVINDFAFLDTLPARDKRAGIAEAVKVALIRDRDFFDSLYREREALARFAPQAMRDMVRRCAELHLEHISGGGDPFEAGSSRPLDFGHWVAHKLEELSHSELRHGEAVAIGIALDSLYSHHLGSLAELDLYRILTLLETLGFSLHHAALSWLDVERALGDFREHLGGELSIPLLAGIGRKIEAHHIDVDLMKRCIAQLAERAGDSVGGKTSGTAEGARSGLKAS